MTGPKVLSILVGGEEGGVAVVWERLSSAMVDRGVELDAAFMTHGTPVEHALARSGVRTRRVYGYRLTPIPPGGRAVKLVWVFARLVGQVAALPGLIQMLRAERYRAALFQSPQELLLIGLAGRLAGVRVYWLMPTVLSDDYRGVNRAVYRAVLRLTRATALPNSSATNRSLGGDVGSRRVLPLGVSTTEFDDQAFSSERSQLRRVLGLESLAVFGALGRIEPSKGQLRLLQAMESLGRAREDCAFVFCGEVVDPSYRDLIVRTAESLGIGHRVHFLEPRSDVRGVLAALDVVCSVSEVVESFGLTLVEGMSMRKPVLAMAAGGPLDIIVDGECGWLWQDEPGSLAATLDRALDARAIWGAMGEAARGRVKEKFNIDRTVNQLLDVIEGQVPKPQ